MPPLGLGPDALKHGGPKVGQMRLPVGIGERAENQKGAASWNCACALEKTLIFLLLCNILQLCQASNSPLLTTKVYCLPINGWRGSWNRPLKKVPVNDITFLLQASGRREDPAREELFKLVYEELRRMAAARMAREAAGQTLQPTALVHEAWLQLVGDGERTWENRAHFFGAAADAMRRILIDAARRKVTLKRGGGLERVDINELDLAQASPDEHVLLINEALEDLEKEDPVRARIVVLKFFGGLTNREVAQTLGLGERSVERQWAAAKARLFQWIRNQR